MALCGCRDLPGADLGGCWSRDNGECVGAWRAERYFRCITLYHFPPVLPDAAATVRAVYGVWPLGMPRALSGPFDATLRSFPIGFLDNSARLNQISANQISANEQKRVKPGIGVTHRPRMVDRKRSERRSIGSARHLAAHGASRDVRTPPAQTSDPRAHMMFRDVQCHVGRQPPPPKARHFAQRKVAAPAPTMSQTSRQPTAQKRPPPSR